MSLSRLLAEEMQVCPTSLLTPPILASCIEWQNNETASATAVASTQYDCSHDDYLASFTPGQYAGTTANYLSFNTAQSTGHFVARAKLFEECTGGIINFAEATDIAEDPINDIGSTSSTGAELYDAYLMIYSFTSEASSLGLLETLNDRIRQSNTLLKYEDILPKVRSMGEYRKDGKTNIDLLMADGDFFVPIVRIDLLERDGKPLPHTWEDVVELAKFYNGTDLNDDGVADDYGFCIYPRTGSGFNDAWIPELMYSTWATTDQTRGIQEGFFFDDETFEPRIGNGFEHAMDIWKDLWANSADGCITSNFVEGRCAIGLAPPGCWKGVFVNSEEGGVAWRDKTDGSVLRDENGEPLWRPTMKDGSYAEPYRLRPFGSLNVVDRETDEWVECAPETCPKGEKIQSASELPPDDRAGVLADSPHTGKLINRVPFYWSGGYGTGIRKSAAPAAKDLMWDFFVYVNTPITTVEDVVLPSWLDAWRYSQLTNCKGNEWSGEESSNEGCNFQRGGWSFDTWNEHQKTMQWALGNEVNSALTLRLPGVLTYTRDVVLPKFVEYMDGAISMADLKVHVRQGWEDATATQGKSKQVQIYRASLGLNPLSELDLCRLHDENCVELNENLLPKSWQIFGLVIVSINFLLAIIFASWTIYFRKDPVVKLGQKEFLLLLCGGSFLSSSSIIPLSFQAGTFDDTTAASRACMTVPWLYSTGWILQYSSLFAKSYRMLKVMKGAQQMRQAIVKAKETLRFVFAALLLNWAIVIPWTIVDPFTWERIDLGATVSEDAGVITQESVGRCSSDHLSVWVGTMLGYHLLIMVGTNLILWQLRFVNDRYQESKYVTLASLFAFEFLLLGVPILMAVGDSSELRYIVLVFIIAFSDLGILLMVFVPKIKFQRKGLPEDQSVVASIINRPIQRQMSNLSTDQFSTKSSRCAKCSSEMKMCCFQCHPEIVFKTDQEPVPSATTASATAASATAASANTAISGISMSGISPDSTA